MTRPPVPRFRDGRGNTVEVQSLSYEGRTSTVFVARTPDGLVLGRTYGSPEHTCWEDVAAAGVDLETVQPLTS